MSPTSPVRGPVFVDLFCGAGGFTQGLRQAGWAHGVGVELDATAAETYARNHGAVLRQDVRTLRGDDVLAALGGRRPALLAASPPCQSFSAVGARAVADPRDSLYEHVLRLAAELSPRFVVLENVKGLLTKRAPGGALVLEAMLQGLERIGYTARHRVLAGQDFEVPQARHRVIIVAARSGDVAFPAPVAGFDAAVRRFLTPEPLVPDKYFAPPHRRAFFEGKPAKYAHYLDLDRPCRTLRACYSKNRGADALVRYSRERVRMLTEHECAAIQTFPPAYNFAGSMTQVYRQVGNAIPPNLAMHIGRALLQGHPPALPDDA